MIKYQWPKMEKWDNLEMISTLVLRNTRGKCDSNRPLHKLLRLDF